MLKITPIQKLTTPQTLNNSSIQWTFLLQKGTNSKIYDIELSIVYLSSKRQIKVNGELRLTTMINFGMNGSFQICEGVQGRIKQDGMRFEFELFINETSFTELEKNKEKYQGPVLDDLQNKNLAKRNPHAASLKSEPLQQIGLRNSQKRQQKKSIGVIKRGMDESGGSKQEIIKQTQSDLMKILKAQKMLKKEVK